jgi:hypothetical protein
MEIELAMVIHTSNMYNYGWSLPFQFVSLHAHYHQRECKTQIASSIINRKYFIDQLCLLLLSITGRNMVDLAFVEFDD